MFASLQVACGDPARPEPSDVTIRLDVNGGFTGTAFTLEIDGAAGVARGVACAAGCDFEPGALLLPLSNFQVVAIAQALEDAGVPGYKSRDFGVLCCDQFVYTLAYARNGRTGDFTGSSEALPAVLREVVSRVHALVQSRLPVVVDFASVPGDWPGDPLVIDSIRVDGPELTVHSQYPGCRDHPIDVVFWTGFTESERAQAEAVLAHDARGDACAAVAGSTRVFDLTPLRAAWHRSHGPGAGSIVLRLRPPGSAASVAATFRF